MAPQGVRLWDDSSTISCKTATRSLLTKINNFGIYNNMVPQ